MHRESGGRFARQGAAEADCFIHGRGCLCLHAPVVPIMCGCEEGLQLKAAFSPAAGWPRERHGFLGDPHKKSPWHISPAEMVPIFPQTPAKT